MIIGDYRRQVYSGTARQKELFYYQNQIIHVKGRRIAPAQEIQETNNGDRREYGREKYQTAESGKGTAAEFRGNHPEQGDGGI